MGEVVKVLVLSCDSPNEEAEKEIKDLLNNMTFWKVKENSTFHGHSYIRTLKKPEK